MLPLWLESMFQCRILNKIILKRTSQYNNDPRSMIRLLNNAKDGYELMVCIVKFSACKKWKYSIYEHHQKGMCTWFKWYLVKKPLRSEVEDKNTIMKNTFLG